MATSTPKPTAILADVKTELEEITVANSFRNTVQTVDNQFINPETIGAKLPALAVYAQSVDWVTATIGSTPLQLGILRFKIQGIMQVYSSAATNISSLIQDVREKLFEDRKRSSNATNTRITHVEFGGEAFGGSFGNPPFVQAPFIGFLMDVEVDYQENL